MRTRSETVSGRASSAAVTSGTPAAPMSVSSVAELVAGGEHLALDVDPVLGEQAVDGGEDARGVGVQVREPVRGAVGLEGRPAAG